MDTYRSNLSNALERRDFLFPVVQIALEDSVSAVAEE